MTNTFAWGPTLSALYYDANQHIMNLDTDNSAINFNHQNDNLRQQDMVIGQWKWSTKTD